MYLKRYLAAIVAAGMLTGIAMVAQQSVTPADKMTTAAQKFLGSLNAEQKAKAVMAFDSKERTFWNFVPMQDNNRKPTRKGVPLYELNDKQRALVMDLLATGTSADGKKKAAQIMLLEDILDKLEVNGRNVRSSSWYFVSIFGTPSKTGTWGWRLEGHHLSLNYTIKGGKIVSTTPAFFGSNPAVVFKGGPKGLDTLPDAEKLPRKLFLELNERQKVLAFRKEHFGEPEQKKAAYGGGKAVGLPASKMTKAQKNILKRLITSYANRMPASIAKMELRRIEESGTDNIHFAYSGGTGKRDPHTYRVQGPTFVIEFLNTQPSPDGAKANHIHSCWRSIGGDFGL